MQQVPDGKDGARAHLVARRHSLDDALQEGRHNFRAVGCDAIDGQMLDQRHLEHIRRLPALLRDNGKSGKEKKRKESGTDEDGQEAREPGGVGMPHEASQAQQLHQLHLSSHVFVFVFLV